MAWSCPRVGAMVVWRARTELTLSAKPLYAAEFRRRMCEPVQVDRTPARHAAEFDRRTVPCGATEGARYNQQDRPQGPCSLMWSRQVLMIRWQQWGRGSSKLEKRLLKAPESSPRRPPEKSRPRASPRGAGIPKEKATALRWLGNVGGGTSQLRTRLRFR